MANVFFYSKMEYLSPALDAPTPGMRLGWAAHAYRLGGVKKMELAGKPGSVVNGHSSATDVTACL
jgi:hypothetical protein